MDRVIAALVHVAQSYGFLTPPKVESQSAHNVISNQTGDAIRIVSNDGVSLQGLKCFANVSVLTDAVALSRST